jgi:hypothetical protein
MEKQTETQRRSLRGDRAEFNTFFFYKTGPTLVEMSMNDADDDVSCLVINPLSVAKLVHRTWHWPRSPISATRFTRLNYTGNISKPSYRSGTTKQVHKWFSCSPLYETLKTTVNMSNILTIKQCTSNNGPLCPEQNKRIHGPELQVPNDVYRCLKRIIN